MSPTSPKVDGFIRKNKRWSAELTALREIVLAADLTEDVKWRVPCYTLDGANVVMLGCYQDACILSFVKGALIEDAGRLLQRVGENTQAARLIKFANVGEIAAIVSTLAAFVREAIAVERAGLKVEMKRTADFAVPDEVRAAFAASPKLKAAFDALTPGRQRGYLLHFAGAKQSKTRTARVEKHAPRILAGKGLDDD